MWEVNPIAGLNPLLAFMVSHECRVSPMKADKDILTHMSETLGIRLIFFLNHLFIRWCLHSLTAPSLERAKEDGSGLRCLPAGPCCRGDTVDHQRSVVPAADLPLHHHHLQVSSGTDGKNMETEVEAQSETTWLGRPADTCFLSAQSLQGGDSGSAEIRRWTSLQVTHTHTHTPCDPQTPPLCSLGPFTGLCWSRTYLCPQTGSGPWLISLWSM